MLDVVNALLGLARGRQKSLSMHSVLPMIGKSLLVSKTVHSVVLLMPFSPYVSDTRPLYMHSSLPEPTAVLNSASSGRSP